MLVFFQDLGGLTEVFGRMSAGISGPKLPLWAEFSFLKTCIANQSARERGRKFGNREWGGSRKGVFK